MKPNLFLVRMFNSVSIQDRDKLSQLLEIFESDENFFPTAWGNDERIRVNYNREEIIGKVLSDELEFSDIYLHRNKSVKYTGSFQTSLTLRSFSGFEVDKSMPKKYWKKFFELSDMIAEVVKPRYGITHIFWPPSIPWKNEEERMHRWMNICAQPTPVKLAQHGPMGVGIRTYFSGDFIELLGREFLLNVPAVVSQLDWGGICIDLVDEPWEAEIKDILDVWVNVMNYLEKTQVFAIPSFNEDCRGVSFSVNTAWKNRKRRNRK